MRRRWNDGLMMGQWFDGGVRGIRLLTGEVWSMIYFQAVPHRGVTGTLAFCPIVPIVRRGSSIILSGEKRIMESRPREDLLEFTSLEQVTTDDYSPMRPSDNPLIALAGQLGYRISSLRHEMPSGHHVQHYRGEAATVTIYEDDLLKLVFHLIEHTQSACLPEVLAKQQKSNTPL